MFGTLVKNIVNEFLSDTRHKVVHCSEIAYMTGYHAGFSGEWEGRERYKAKLGKASTLCEVNF
jgi:hypothetical protein